MICRRSSSPMSGNWSSGHHVRQQIEPQHPLLDRVIPIRQRQPSRRYFPGQHPCRSIGRGRLDAPGSDREIAEHRDVLRRNPLAKYCRRRRASRVECSPGNSARSQSGSMAVASERIVFTSFWRPPTSWISAATSSRACRERRFRAPALRGGHEPVRSAACPDRAGARRGR